MWTPAGLRACDLGDHKDGAGFLRPRSLVGRVGGLGLRHTGSRAVLGCQVDEGGGREDSCIWSPGRSRGMTWGGAVSSRKSPERGQTHAAHPGPGWRGGPRGQAEGQGHGASGMWC